MSENEDKKEQINSGALDGAPSGMLEDLNNVIENLIAIEDSLRQLQNRAQESKEVSLNYYLDMATQTAGQRLRDAKIQKSWLCNE
ncbi:MAG: hypothetical protein QM488_10285 [Rhizobiaceae bacterium]